MLLPRQLGGFRDLIEWKEPNVNVLNSDGSARRHKTRSPAHRGGRQIRNRQVGAGLGEWPSGAVAWVEVDAGHDPPVRYIHEASTGVSVWSQTFSEWLNRVLPNRDGELPPWM